MAINDQVLKGSGLLPGWLTGKLSDFAGLLFFPLLCTAGVDLLLMATARLGAPVDFSLRRAKLVIAILFTAALFAAMNVSQPFADALAGLVGDLGIPSTIVADPADLMALPCLAIAYWLGRAEIARVPLGRIEVIERAHQRGDSAALPQLRDVIACGGDPARVEQLAVALESYFESGDGVEAAAEALDHLRG